MLRRLLARLLEPYINDMVDKRFKEKMHERYYESKQKDLKERIERLRNSYLPPPTQRIQTETKREEEPSSVLEVPGPEEPKLRKKNVKNRCHPRTKYQST